MVMTGGSPCAIGWDGLTTQSCSRSVRFPPLQRTGRAGQRGERTRLVRGVQEDDAHALLHVFGNEPRLFVRQFVMPHVRPVNEHVGIGQYLVGDAVLGIVEQLYARFDVPALFQKFFDDGMKAIRIGPVRPLPTADRPHIRSRSSLLSYFLLPDM